MNNAGASPAPEGHRHRLRSRFLTAPDQLTENELLELVLTFVIQRKDVAPIAEELLRKFGTIASVLETSIEELKKIDGVGESTAIFLKTIGAVYKLKEDDQVDNMKRSREEDKSSNQLNLFGADPISASGQEAEGDEQSAEKPMRGFSNDEIRNSLDFLPKAAEFTTVETYHQYLIDNLPYNSIATREEGSRLIMARFFASGKIDNSIMLFASHCETSQDLKPLVFYHTVKTEPIVTRVAEELIWPALPIGRIDREQIRECILRHLPDLKIASQAKNIRSVLHTYQLCSVGVSVKDSLRFNLRQGTFEGFLYVFTYHLKN